MISVELIGYAAAGITTFSQLPQLMRVMLTQDTRSLSFWTYLCLNVGVALWCLYGYERADHIILYANIICFCITFPIMVSKIVHMYKNSESAKPLPQELASKTNPASL